MAAVKQRSVHPSFKLHTAWGAIEVQPQIATVMPVDDNTPILERITLRMLGISPNAELDRIARGKFKRSAGTYQWYDNR